MDLCATATAAGAPWVYRGTVFDQDLSEVIARAISQPGFAMLDIWELCTAYYSPRNKLKRQDLFDIIDRNHFKRGLIADNPRPEFSVLYHEQSQNNRELLKTKPTIKTKFTHTLNEKKGFIISGSAGQKIRSAATMFALASMYSGLEVTQKDDYPITVMTGHSTSELVISPEPINYNAIESPNYILLISEEGLKVSRSRIEKLPENCKLLADSSLELPETKASVFTFPFLKTARKINRFSVGIVALAVLIRYSEIFPLEALEKAITTHQSPQIADINIQALEAGAKLY